MKKLAAVATITGVLFATGCASTSPWSGIPSQERNAWSGIGIQAYEAKEFRRNGFTPLDVKDWVQLGINSTDTIISWHRAGFSAEQTSKWLAKGLTLKEAIDLTH
ncbi:hypothetical protein MHM95_18020 [Pseudoalteromonas sp. CnMc7-15]|uniref:hypothetical protein n=1 Tax=unclassified Pseudoalteromonas TaxID=194690 RepID=UPI001EF6704B|nr:hypothetical protein [Pseudoalteromonas sp. CnMc7-15]MCG7568171.1 hypothetical protein [Pseudoalteromonas sp. CnMc7-15]